MTRAEDIRAAVDLGARYVGVVFAGGPRTLGVEEAHELLAGVPAGVGRVGVFGRDLEPGVVGEIAGRCRLDVVQLHGDPVPRDVAAVRTHFAGVVWAALRVRGVELPRGAAELFRSADAVVVDAYSPASLGGTGVALPWGALAASLGAARAGGRLVLAGGLRPDTVGEAVRALRPDVVDVSSGVESAPGIKDRAKLRAFRDALDDQVARA
jgi:phosphoribosylanthranilate isomerase